MNELGNILLQGWFEVDYYKYITVKDFILTPIYFGIILFFFLRYRNKVYPEGHPWRKHFTYAFLAKLIGAMAIGLIYQYYYGGGDTATYFYHSTVINDAIFEDPAKGFNIMFGLANPVDGSYGKWMAVMVWYNEEGVWIVCVIAAILNFLTFVSFIPTSLLFAAITFSGSWALFRAFAKQYPQITKYIAIGCLYVPSVIIWGSGIFKDTLCMFGLGWLTYLSIELFIKGNFSVFRIIQFLLAATLVIKIKLYIFMAFAPALSLWIFLLYTSRIQNSSFRIMLNLVVFATCIVGFMYFTQVFAQELGKYSLENIAMTSEITRGWITTASKQVEGSLYDLGAFDPTPLGMLKKFPKAVNVTLFRPYLWEARSVMSLINAIEMFFFGFYTLKVLIAVGPLRTIRTIIRDPNIQFFLVFSLIFAFAVGLSSYNFGALSRYRIPCLPFYMLFLIFVYYKNKPVTSNFLAINFK